MTSFRPAPDPRSFALLALATLLAHANGLLGDFQFDDYNVIVHNPAVHSLAAWWEGAFGIRPLLKLTYALNWISGVGVLGFHAVNLALHLANAWLVFLILLRFPGRNREWSALAAALLFALHPVQSEAVTYVSGRSVALMAFFALLAWLAYVRGVEGERRAWLWLLVPVLYAAALASKEVALALPCVLVLWERLAWGTGWKAIARRQFLLWLMTLSMLLLMLWHPRYGYLLEFSFDLRSAGENLVLQVEGVSHLLSRLVAMASLSIDPALPGAVEWDAGLAFKAALLATGLVVAGWWRRAHPWLAFGVFSATLFLLPTNSVVPRLDVANERQLYLANVGLFFILARAGCACLDRWPGRRMAGAALLVLLLGLGGMTHLRNRDYYTETALWQATVQVSPHNARAWNNLGHALMLEGRLPEARNAWRQALAIDPGYLKARQNLERWEP